MMKRISITMLLMCVSMSAFAQESKSFFDQAFSTKGMIFGAIGALIGLYIGMRKKGDGERLK